MYPIPDGFFSFLMNAYSRRKQIREKYDLLVVKYINM